MRQYELLVRAADLAVAAVQGVRPDQHTRPTPCAEWDVRALLDHLAYVAQLGERAATRRPDVGSADFPVLAKRLTDAWSDPEAWEGTTEFGTGEVPAALAAELTMGDLVLHGWDLARATDQEFRCDDELAGAVEASARGMGEMARSLGLFGAEVPVKADATPLERALAASGRAPSWPAAPH